MRSDVESGKSACLRSYSYIVMKNASLAIMPLTFLVGFLDCEVLHSQTIGPLTAAGQFHMECMQKISRRLVGWSHIHSSGEVYHDHLDLYHFCIMFPYFT